MIWAGSPFAHRIEFSTGLPTGAVSYQLLGNDGAVLVDDELTPEVGALDCLIFIAGANNGCTQPLFENRTLMFHYLTANGLVSDRIAYRVEKPIPFSASADGVRSKLGVESHELRDGEIDLVTAYSEFLTYGDATPYETSGDRNTLLCVHAIEALAGLLALASLQLKVAQRETSGTNEFQRFTKVDWARIEGDLLAHIDRARSVIDPTFDATGGEIFSFGAAGRATDAVTAESN